MLVVFSLAILLVTSCNLVAANYATCDEARWFNFDIYHVQHPVTVSGTTRAGQLQHVPYSCPSFPTDAYSSGEWLSFWAPYSGVVSISTCNAHNPNIYILEGTSCNDFTCPTVVRTWSCGPDDAHGSGIRFDVEQGRKYNILVKARPGQNVAGAPDHALAWSFDIAYVSYSGVEIYYDFVSAYEDCSGSYPYNCGNYSYTFEDGLQIVRSAADGPDGAGYSFTDDFGGVIKLPGLSSVVFPLATAPSNYYATWINPAVYNVSGYYQPVNVYVCTSRYCGTAAAPGTEYLDVIDNVPEDEYTSFHEYFINGIIIENPEEVDLYIDYFYIYYAYLNPNQH